MESTNRVWAAGLALVCLGLLPGCGSDPYSTVEVTGRVMCGDKPAWGGVITFQPIDAPDKTGRPGGNPGGVSRAIVQEDGSFQLEYEARGASEAKAGAVVGPHRVTFIPPMTEPRKWSKQDDWLPEEDKAKLKEEIANDKVYPKLECGIDLEPAEVEVLAQGGNEFEFRLGAASPPLPPVRTGGSD